MSCIKTACVGPNVEGSVGWMEDEQLKICFFWGPAGFHFFLSFFLSKLYLGGEKKTMIPVYSTFKLFERGNNDLEASFSFFVLICIWLHECQKQLKAHKPSTRHLQLQNLDHTNSCRLLRTQERCGWDQRVGQSQAEESVRSSLRKGFFGFSC